MRDDAARLDRHAGHAREVERRLHTTSASAKPRATLPTALVATPATLSGQSSKTRGAPGAVARSTLAAAGRGSHVTRTASAPSAARYGSSATTTATASPTWRTTISAIAWW